MGTASTPPDWQLWSARGANTASAGSACTHTQPSAFLENTVGENMQACEQVCLCSAVWMQPTFFGMCPGNWKASTGVNRDPQLSHFL